MQRNFTFAFVPKENDFDVNKVSVPLPIYAHVGIYIGNDEVVHFSGTGDLEGKRTVHICSVKEFLHSETTHKTVKDIYIMHFPGDGRRPYKLYPDTSKLKFNPAHIDAFEVFDFSDFHCYSNAETVRRAKLMVEDKTYNDYDFLHNNCEHLALKQIILSLPIIPGILGMHWLGSITVIFKRIVLQRNRKAIFLSCQKSSFLASIFLRTTRLSLRKAMLLKQSVKAVPLFLKKLID